MGLDMFMNAEKYISGEDYSSDRQKMTYRVLTTAIGLTEEETDSLRRKSVNVSVGVGYWRKAHDLHDWFVSNVQDGNDNCAEYYVSRENLEDLKKTIELVLADPKEYQNEFSSFSEWDTDTELVFRSTLVNIEEWLSPAYAEFDFKYHASW